MTSSIKARLLAQARWGGEEFELFLVRYACERFLYRLEKSGFREQCTVKGAVLLNLWLDDPYRATRDLDLSAPQEVDVHIVPSEARPRGVGEVGVPPFAAALCNAICAATGKRVRKLPLSGHDLSWS